MTTIVQKPHSQELLSVLVLIDCKVEEKLSHLDMSMIKEELQSETVAVEFFRDIDAQIFTSKPQRLVFGICNDNSKFLGVAQKFGFDPFGVSFVSLEACCTSDVTLATARAILLLEAAIARCRAFCGSQPQNKKAKLTRKSKKLSRRDFFSLPKLEYASVPSVHKNLCRAALGCDQCARVCPHDAIKKEEDSIFIDRDKCSSCGVCAVSCPSQAVYFPKWSYQEVTAQITTLVQTKRLASRPILFVCANTSLTQMSDWLPVYVPCQAFVSVALILQSLYYGATAIAIHSCGEKCTTGKQKLLEQRVEYCQQLLTQLNISSDRIRFITSQDSTVEKAPQFAPLIDKSLNEPISLFGSDANGKAIENFSQFLKEENLLLQHPGSPLGVIRHDDQVCTCCGTCAQVCPTDALSYRKNGDILLEFSASSCIACSRCEAVCPEQQKGAIFVEKKTDLQLILKGKKILSQDREICCKRCGNPFASYKMVKKIKAILGNTFAPVMEELCSDCRGQF